MEAAPSDEHSSWRVLRAIADGKRHSFDELVAPDRRDDRSTVRRGLDELQRLGMPIDIDDEGVTALPFVPLSSAAIREHLGDGPWTVEVVYATGSTNADLLRTIRTVDDPFMPRLLAAEVQRAGRGRLGRSWHAAPGACLTVSFALPVARPLSSLDGVTLACGLAIRDSLAARGAGRIAMKWPNDLVVDDRKLAGILVEAHATEDATVLVIGVGINIVPHGAASSLGIADLHATGWPHPDRNAVVADLAMALRNGLDRFALHGFATFVERWNAVDALRGRLVTLRSPSGIDASGMARGVDQGGALIVEVDGERRRVASGEISVRPRTEAKAIAA